MKAPTVGAISTGTPDRVEQENGKTTTYGKVVGV